MTSWWLLLTTSFAVWAIVMAVVIVMQQRSPAATIAWMLVLGVPAGLAISSTV